MTLARSLVALSSIGVAVAALASINPNPPPQANKAGRYMAVIVNLNAELDLACIIWSEQRIECQPIQKSKYKPCIVTNDKLACDQLF